jgi:hypothetical protein
VLPVGGKTNYLRCSINHFGPIISKKPISVTFSKFFLYQFSPPVLCNLLKNFLHIFVINFLSDGMKIVIIAMISIIKSNSLRNTGTSLVR